VLGYLRTPYVFILKRLTSTIKTPATTAVVRVQRATCFLHKQASWNVIPGRILIVCQEVYSGGNGSIGLYLLSIGTRSLAHAHQVQAERQGQDAGPAPAQTL
jgi:hypothetical protein